LWLTLSKPTGLIYLKPPERKRDGERLETPQSASHRKAFAGECPEVGRVLWVLNQKKQKRLGPQTFDGSTA